MKKMGGKNKDKRRMERKKIHEIRIKKIEINKENDIYFVLLIWYN